MDTYSDIISYMTFGEYLSMKRREKEITSTYVTEELDISPGYFCDIEKGRRKPPCRSILAKIVQILNLTGEDLDIFYDLAGKARNEAPPDLPEYINQNQIVRDALRLAKDKGGEGDWLKFIDNLKNKNSRGEKQCFS